DLDRPDTVTHFAEAVYGCGKGGEPDAGGFGEWPRTSSLWPGGARWYIGLFDHARVDAITRIGFRVWIPAKIYLAEPESKPLTLLTISDFCCLGDPVSVIELRHLNLNVGCGL